MGNAARLAKIKKTLGPPPTKALYLESPDWMAPDGLPEGATVVQGHGYDTLWVREGERIVGIALMAPLGLPFRAEAEAHARQLLAGAKAKAPGSRSEPEAVGPLREPSAIEARNRTR